MNGLIVDTADETVVFNHRVPRVIEIGDAVETVVNEAVPQSPASADAADDTRFVRTRRTVHAALVNPEMETLLLRSYRNHPIAYSAEQLLHVIEDRK